MQRLTLAPRPARAPQDEATKQKILFTGTDRVAGELGIAQEAMHKFMGGAADYGYAPERIRDPPSPHLPAPRRPPPERPGLAPADRG